MSQIVTVPPMRHGLMNHLKKYFILFYILYFIFIVLEIVPLVCLDSACETPALTWTCDTVHQLPTTKILLLCCKGTPHI